MSTAPQAPELEKNERDLREPAFIDPATISQSEALEIIAREREQHDTGKMHIRVDRSALPSFLR